MNIVGYHIFDKTDISSKSNDWILKTLKKVYEKEVRLRVIDCNDDAQLNGYKPFVDELDIDFITQRLILVIQRDEK